MATQFPAFGNSLDAITIYNVMPTEFSNGVPWTGSNSSMANYNPINLNDPILRSCTIGNTQANSTISFRDLYSRQFIYTWGLDYDVVGGGWTSGTFSSFNLLDGLRFESSGGSNGAVYPTWIVEYDTVYSYGIISNDTHIASITDPAVFINAGSGFETANITFNVTVPNTCGVYGASPTNEYFSSTTGSFLPAFYFDGNIGNRSRINLNIYGNAFGGGGQGPGVSIISSIGNISTDSAVVWGGGGAGGGSDESGQILGPTSVSDSGTTGSNGRVVSDITSTTVGQAYGAAGGWGFGTTSYPNIPSSSITLGPGDRPVGASNFVDGQLAGGIGGYEGGSGAIVTLVTARAGTYTLGAANGTFNSSFSNPYGNRSYAVGIAAAGGGWGQAGGLLSNGSIYSTPGYWLFRANTFSVTGTRFTINRGNTGQTRGLIQ